MEIIVLLAVLVGLGIIEFSNLKAILLSIVEFGNQYSGFLSLLTSLILAYATWRYVVMGRKTLNFMKESFEKEYEEDIKFMFIQRPKREIKEEFVTNDQLIIGKLDDKDLTVSKDDTYLYINIFNSGRRLISHIQLIYQVRIIDPWEETVMKNREIKTVIQVTVQPNDYISFPLVKMMNLPQVEIVIESLRSFNGLGKEQLLNSPQRKLEYKNKNL
ncbi:hypothetical protein [Sporohalobacter salinus]|uniref:hypothetical protein n=1 Tax=Sporohalobacter salinus TaxID=1494606 RepID=UPI0019609E20|nr:hypothetical protein [Sporohalobacter salinus]MBM7624806.1 hypothetical protein [Sporohalobacter salinus]